MGKKAIIVDCAPQRLARPRRDQGARSRPGLYEVLTGAVPLNQAWPRTRAAKPICWPRPSGRANAVTMFASRPMARLVSVLRGGADFVVIGLRPGGRAAPMRRVIARLADATVLVSRRQIAAQPA